MKLYRAQCCCRCCEAGRAGMQASALTKLRCSPCHTAAASLARLLRLRPLYQTVCGCHSDPARGCWPQVRLREVVDYLSQTMAASQARHAVHAALGAAEDAALAAAAAALTVQQRNKAVNAAAAEAQNPRSAQPTKHGLAIRTAPESAGSAPAEASGAPGLPAAAESAAAGSVAGPQPPTPPPAGTIAVPKLEPSPASLQGTTSLSLQSEACTAEAAPGASAANACPAPEHDPQPAPSHPPVKGAAWPSAPGEPSPAAAAEQLHSLPTKTPAVHSSPLMQQQGLAEAAASPSAPLPEPAAGCIKDESAGQDPAGSAGGTEPSTHDQGVSASSANAALQPRSRAADQGPAAAGSTAVAVEIPQQQAGSRQLPARSLLEAALEQVR